MINNTIIISKGKVETTSSTYKYKMQVQESDSSPSSPSKQQQSLTQTETQVNEKATTNILSPGQQSSTPIECVTEDKTHADEAELSQSN